MSASLDLSNDFAVFDGAETVTLRGPRSASGSAASATMTQTATPALRRALSVREIETSRGKYAAGDMRWHLPFASVVEAPLLGSTITDAEGHAWTILETSRETLGSRWRCTARRWEIAAGLADLVAVLSARWTKSDSGVPVAEWLEMRRGIAARIQPLEQRAANANGTAVDRATHRGYLAEACGIDAAVVESGLRIRCGDALYAVLGVDDLERLDRGTTLLLEALP